MQNYHWALDVLANALQIFSGEIPDNTESSILGVLSRPIIEEFREFRRPESNIFSIQCGNRAFSRYEYLDKTILLHSYELPQTALPT